MTPPPSQVVGLLVEVILWKCWVKAEALNSQKRLGSVFPPAWSRVLVPGPGNSNNNSRGCELEKM